MVAKKSLLEIITLESELPTNEESLEIVCELLPAHHQNNGGLAYTLQSYRDQFSPQPDDNGKIDFASTPTKLDDALSIEDIGELLDTEHDYLVQLERLECLESLFKTPFADNDELSEKMSAQELAYHKLHRATVATARKKSLNTEKAFASLDALLEESRSRYETKQIALLNAPSDVFMDGAFGKGDKFGNLLDLEMVFEDSYALWVSDAQYGQWNEYADIAEKAFNHDALFVANANVRSRLKASDKNKRRDLPRVLGKDPIVISKEDLEPFNKLQNANVTASSVTICGSPLRIRLADHGFGEVRDPTIPLSFVLAGKLFFVANESNEHNVHSAVTGFGGSSGNLELRTAYIDQRLRTKLAKDDRDSPHLYSYNGALRAIDAQNIVFLRGTDGGVFPRHVGVYSISLSGLQTIREGQSEEDRFSLRLVRAAMKRYLAFTSQKYKSKDMSEVERWCNEIVDEYSVLCGDGEERPFLSVHAEKVVVDGKVGIKIIAVPKLAMGEVPITFAFDVQEQKED